MSSHSSQRTLSINNLQKEFSGNVVFQEIDIEFNSGEISIIIGPNGAGKSVLLSCITGNLSYTGQIMYGSSPIYHCKNKYSSLIQGSVVDPELTGRENLEFYHDLHPQGSNKWEELVKELNVSEDIDRLVSEYSGGMRRKIELSIALSPDVPLYILDEPTNELDLNMMRVVHNNLLDLKNKGKTIVMTSHSPLDMQIADRLIILTNGKVLFDDSPSNLLREIPHILRIRGVVPDEDILKKYKVYQRGDEIRVFIDSKEELDNIKDKLNTMYPQAVIDIDTSSFSDLFNYIIQV